jgi:hypothetical protein
MPYKCLSSAPLVSMQRRNESLHLELRGISSVHPAKIPSFARAALAHFGKSLAKAGVTEKTQPATTKTPQACITGGEACLCWTGDINKRDEQDYPNIPLKTLHHAYREPSLICCFVSIPRLSQSRIPKMLARPLKNGPNSLAPLSRECLDGVLRHSSTLKVPRSGTETRRSFGGTCKGPGDSLVGSLMIGALWLREGTHDTQPRAGQLVSIGLD